MLLEKMMAVPMLHQTLIRACQDGQPLDFTAYKQPIAHLVVEMILQSIRPPEHHLSSNLSGP